jgi:hypothetical protein
MKTYKDYVVQYGVDRDGDWIFNIFKNGELKKTLTFARISHNIDTLIKSTIDKMECEK